MTRPESVRFLRTEPTMAFPRGRLVAVRDGRRYVLAPEGWTPLGGNRPSGPTPMSRKEAEDWCAREGRDLNMLDEVPTLRL
jgi:hypothetical protein